MEQIKEAIAMSGLTMQEIQQRTGISVPNLFKFVSGGNPTASTLQKIADATDTPIIINPKKRIISSSYFTSHQEWLRHSIGGMDIVLSRISALEYMGLFPGYMDENMITCYAAFDPQIAGLEVDTKKLRKIDIDGRTTTFDRTVNDILDDADEDPQPLIEALSFWLETGHPEPVIEERNKAAYQKIKEAAEDYYSGGYDD